MEEAWFLRPPLKVTSQLNYKALLKDASISVQRVASHADVARRDLLKSLSSDPTKMTPDAAGIVRNLESYTAIVNGALEHSNTTFQQSVVSIWSDTLYTSKVRTERKDAAFDLGNIFVNCALWYAKRAGYIIAPSVCVSETIKEQNSKESYQLLRSAAGLLGYVSQTIIPKLKQIPDPMSDLDNVVLQQYQTQFLAEAQELALFRCLHQKYSFEVTGPLAAATGEKFMELEHGISPKNGPKNMNDDTVKYWQRYGLVKHNLWMAVARCCQAEMLLANNQAGEAIRCVEEAKNHAKVFSDTAAKSRKDLGGVPDYAFHLVTKWVEKTGGKVERENTLLHHQRAAPEVPAALGNPKFGIAESTPFSAPANHDLWNDVLPGTAAEKDSGSSCSLM